jgi:hypothetical protein
MKQLWNNKLVRIVSFISLGGLGGFAYYYFIGCQGGTCPISSNPYISTSYGMMVGLLLSFDSKKKKDREEN